MHSLSKALHDPANSKSSKIVVSKSFIDIVFFTDSTKLFGSLLEFKSRLNIAIGTHKFKNMATNVNDRVAVANLV